MNYNKEENTKQKSQKASVVFEYLSLKEFTIISYERTVNIHSIFNSNSLTQNFFKIDSPPPEA